MQFKFIVMCEACEFETGIRVHVRLFWTKVKEKSASSRRLCDGALDIELRVA